MGVHFSYEARQKRQTTSLDQAPPIASDSNRSDFAAIHAEQSHRLIHALSTLPYAQREVVLLHLYTGLKFKAIAELQNESINTIQGRYRYGLNKLRTLLNTEVEK